MQRAIYERQFNTNGILSLVAKNESRLTHRLSCAALELTRRAVVGGSFLTMASLLFVALVLSNGLPRGEEYINAQPFEVFDPYLSFSLHTKCV